MRGTIKMVLVELGMFVEAVAAYDRATELEPDDAKAWNNKGDAHAELGRFEDAMAAYDRALALKPDVLNGGITGGILLMNLAGS